MKMKQTIQCTTPEQFYEAIYQCTIKGLTFVAYADKLIIELLGGY